MSTAAASARTNVTSLRRLLPNWAWMLVSLAVAILYPYILDQLLATPDDLLDASIQTLAYIIMALGLNIVVGFAGLLDLGYVAFFAIGAFVMGWLGSQQFPDVNGGKGIHILTPAKSAFGSALSRHPRQLLLHHLHRGDLHGVVGRHPRRPDAAIARRLPGHRDAGLRRDRAAHLRERDERHLRHRQHRLLQRAPGHHADRQGQLPLDRREVQISTRAQTDLLRRAGDGPARHLLQPPAARLADGARVDRGARGRGRRRGHGRQPRAHEAVGLRARRRPRRLRGRLPGHLQQHGQRRPVRVRLLGADPVHGHHRRHGQHLGRHPRRHRPVDVQPLRAQTAQRRAGQVRAGLRRDLDQLRHLRLLPARHDGPAARGLPPIRADANSSSTARSTRPTTSAPSPTTRSTTSARTDDRAGCAARRARAGQRRRAAPRGDQHLEDLRRPGRRQRHHLHGAPARDRLAHRPQRRRQDDVLQLHDRALQAHHRARPLQRQGHHRQAPGPRHPSRRRAHLPEHQAVPDDDVDRERAGRDARADALARHRDGAAHALQPARGEGVLRQGARALELRRPQAPQRAGHEPALRRSAPAGDRARAGLRSAAAAPRRADGGHEPEGVRAAAPAHGDACAPTAASRCCSSSTT